jgi:hypothetical protein
MSKPLRITLQFKGGENGVVPKGESETLVIDITDGIAMYHFMNQQHTRAFALTQEAEGVESKYIERLQKTACKYPGQSAKQIVENIQQNLKRLGAKGGQDGTVQ